MAAVCPQPAIKTKEGNLFLPTISFAVEYFRIEFKTPVIYYKSK